MKTERWKRKQRLSAYRKNKIGKNKALKSNTKYLQGVKSEVILEFLENVPLRKSQIKNENTWDNLWNSINWSQLKQEISQKQSEIFKITALKSDKNEIYQSQLNLIQDYKAKLLAVRRVAHESQGKRTAGIDNIKKLTSRQKLAFAATLHLDGKSSAIKRVMIPKPGSSEMRPLGIPTMNDRAKQALVKLALEPQWEAKCEATSYGFRPGKSAHDAIRGVWNVLYRAERWILDADIEKCFDRIDHDKLISKLELPKDSILEKQIYAWLKAGILEVGQAFPKEPERGTPQGGVISPLLANIALDGIMEKAAKKVASKFGKQAAYKYMHIYRYADDFVVTAPKEEHIVTALQGIEEFLVDVGLNISKKKTKILNTIDKNKCQDGNNSFHFLGMNFCQYPIKSKYKMVSINKTSKTNIKLIVTPSDKSINNHFTKVRHIIKTSTSSLEIVSRLNPVIRGWTNYIKVSNARTAGFIGKWNTRLYLMLKNWVKSKYGTFRRIPSVWTKIGGNNWVFYANINQEKKALINYGDQEYSVSSYKPVLSNKSPFDGDSKYWQNRIPTYAGANEVQTKVLRRQLFLCAKCKQPLIILDEQIFHIDHITRKADGGDNKLSNLQALHPWCHEEKTAYENSNKFSQKG
jgi:RNA-directed DNA polymerase